MTHQGGRQRGKRIGPYARHAAQQDDDYAERIAELKKQLITESPLASAVVKDTLAERACAAMRQMLQLESGAVTVDERKVLHAFHGAYRRWLELLRVAEKTEEGEDL